MSATEQSKQIIKSKTQPTTESVKLIEGTFDVDEARDILIGILNHKIHFHNVKNLSSSEHFGHLNEQSVVRLEELKRDRDKVLSLIDFARENELDIDIHSNIEIHLKG